MTPIPLLFSRAAGGPITLELEVTEAGPLPRVRVVLKQGATWADYTQAAVAAAKAAGLKNPCIVRYWVVEDT